MTIRSLLMQHNSGAKQIARGKVIEDYKYIIQIFSEL